MPRTMGTANIRAWRAEELISDLALNDKTHAELAEIHGVAEQTVAAFRMRHKAEIAAVLAGMVDQYSHIWSTKLGNRLRVLTQRLEEVEGQILLLHDHARRETETIRSVDPEASEVLVISREYLAYVKEQRALLREIADQTGQLPTRVAVDVAAVRNPLTDYDTVAMDANGNLLGVVQQ
jgi:hypothetical protein